MEMLTFNLNTDSKIPIYHQLYSFIKSEIQSGKIPYDTKLPSKRKLSSYLKISQNTVQAAYDQLIEEGYIISLEKKGFFVSKIDHLQKLQVNSPYELTHQKSESSEVIYDFSYHGVDQATFPFDTWRKLTKDVINEYDTELLLPGDSLGYHRLRAAIAAYLHQSRGVNCTEHQIVISSGTEILFQSLIQLLDKDSIYGIENPGYEKLNQLFTGNRASFTAINIDHDGMLPEEVEKGKANILCVTPAHQFPSGEIMPINRRIRLLNWANEVEGRYIIEDDYDSEFKYSGKPIPVLQGLDNNEKVIYMGSLSKSISPTLRVSYMVLPLHLIKRYHEKLSYILCPVPIIEQKVLCNFIEQGYFERHLNKMRTVYKKKRDTLVKAITDLNKGIEIQGADAGLHLLLKVPNQMTEEQLIDSAMNYGVKTYGISKYYCDKSCVKPSALLLIGYATMTEKEIVQAVTLLDKAWFS
ncbi:MAG TPA: PLP-dependent aminotransferase family protein [Mobilitalea sp.]|nr:PLP-dependent aminotransferase family protein [Mobilitalea sp.]